VIRFYDGLLAERSGSERVGYATGDSQRVRFEALLDVGDLAGASVLEVGCGPGDMYAVMRERFGDGLEYRGVDIHPGFVEHASETYADGVFEVRDILSGDAAPEADYVLSGGVFSLAPNGDPAFVREMLTRMFALARRAVAANFLSARTPNPKDPRCYYAEPAEILDVAFALTPDVVLRHDYKPNDFTVYLRHG